MTRGTAILSVAMVAGVSLLGAGALTRQNAARYSLPAADTASLNGAIAFFEARRVRDTLDLIAARALISRYVQRFGLTADTLDLQRTLGLAQAVAAKGGDPAEDEATLSSAYLMQHAFGEAYAAARRAVKADPMRDAARASLFDAALATGRYALAESLLTSSDAGALPWRVRRAHLLEQRGDVSAAASLLSRACRRLERAGARPQTQAWCLTELARLRGIEHGPSAERQALRRALDVQPGYRGAIEGLADLELGRGAWRPALALYRRIESAAHPDIYLRIAEAEAALGRHARARRLKAEFLRFARVPDNEPLYGLPLAEFYAASPVTRDTALAILHREVARRPAAEVFEALARVHALRGEEEASLGAAELANRIKARPTASM
jgi:Tfp pilus assembly protein PilF